VAVAGKPNINGGTMSGAVVVTPSAGAAWATAWEQFEGIRKGMISLSLTNYDAAAVPQIASGSWIEAVGSIYKWTGNDAIVGAPTNDVINFITMVPSGVGASAILTPTWSDVAPTWSDAYQGWFSGTTRYAAGCYYDGVNYPLKWVYTNRHAGPKTHEIALPLIGANETANDPVWYGMTAVWSAAETTETGSVSIYFPTDGIITELFGQCTARAAGAVNIELRRSALASSTYSAMASIILNAVETQSDTSITTPIIDRSAYTYYVWCDPEEATTLTVSSIVIKYTELVRC